MERIKTIQLHYEIIVYWKREYPRPAVIKCASNYVGLEIPNNKCWELLDKHLRYSHSISKRICHGRERICSSFASAVAWLPQKFIWERIECVGLDNFCIA